MTHTFGSSTKCIDIYNVYFTSASCIYAKWNEKVNELGEVHTYVKGVLRIILEARYARRWSGSHARGDRSLEIQHKRYTMDGIIVRYG